MTDWSRRDVLSAVAGGFAAAATSAAAVTRENPASHPVRIRTITAGVTLSGPDDIGPIDKALERLSRIRKLAQAAGYEVQTIRVATTPLVAGLDAGGRRRALSALEKLDATIAAADALLSIGPILSADAFDAELGSWSAELAQRTQRTSFSVTVATRESGVHRSAIRSAAAVIDVLSRVHPSGSANFNFAAAACVEPGTPFFPVAYHEGPDSLALGLESAGLLHTAFQDSGGADDAADRLRRAMEATLDPLDTLGVRWAGMEHLRYLGIDTSPAPGMDRSIGAAIEAMTGRPFGQLSTLQACANITAVLKSLSIKTCGYCGLMLPVLEDPVLAQRAAERRYGIQELLLYSTVCGTGLDVVPIPGDAGVDAIARIIADVATLAFRLRKPLSARLFPVPGKAAGDVVSFEDPRLTTTHVFDIG